MHLTATRPDLMISVSMLSRFMAAPKESHWEAGKRVLRYVRGTIDHGIHYKKVHNSVLIGYIDNDWGGNVDNHKHVIITLIGRNLMWQSSYTLSSTIVIVLTNFVELINFYVFFPSLVGM